jgi:hypothetical protein
MKTHLEHKFLSLQQNISPYSYCRKSVVVERISADGKPAHGLLLLEKETGKKVLAIYNKTRINIGHHHEHDRWMELKEALRVHQCHCTCSSEIGTCISNDAGIYS